MMAKMKGLLNKKEDKGHMESREGKEGTGDRDSLGRG